ncbi:MAG: hypothetical protein BRC25_03030 [Parcubacteria group bacterium SW_6_46_9]|nr:MAG: hypothetical protein BRC25_03030 [Parcubacteria group bacterium SW_6_46_9]
MTEFEKVALQCETVEGLIDYYLYERWNDVNNHGALDWFLCELSIKLINPDMKITKKVKDTIYDPAINIVEGDPPSNEQLRASARRTVILLNQHHLHNLLTERNSSNHE